MRVSSSSLFSLNLNNKCKLPVSEVYLTNDVDKIEEFTKEKSKGIEVVIMKVDTEIVHKHGLAVPFHVVIQDGRVELHHKHLYFSSFPDFPQITWHIKHNGLKRRKENKL